MGNLIPEEQPLYDGFIDVVEDLGKALHGSNTGYEPGSVRTKSSQRVRAYLESQLVRNAIEVIPTTSLNTFEGWKRDKGAKELDDLTERLYRWYNATCYLPILDALNLARLDGVSYLLICSTDSDDPSKPFNYKKNSSITKLIPLRDDDVTRPGFANQEYVYWVNLNWIQFADLELTWPNCEYGGSTRVHPSRIILVPGLRVSDALFNYAPHGVGNSNTSPHQSIMDSLLPALSGWVSANTAAIQMLETHSAFILGVENLPLLSKREGGKGLFKRLKAMLSSVKKLKGFIYDATTEKAEVVTRTYTGVDTLLRSLADYLDSSCDTPYEFLLYGSKAFENKEGGARQALAQRVAEYQRSHLSPILERVLFMYLSSIGQLEEVDDFSPIFSDGRILTASEKAQTRFKNAQTDALLVNAKLVRPDNPRITREWQENNPYTPEELSGNKPDKTDKRNPVGNALKSQQGREQANGSEVS
jgi:hypothetical protein